MNTNNTSKYIFGFVILVIALAIFIPLLRKPAVVNNPNPTATTTVYTNAQYGFSVTLPLSWTGYSIVSNTWSGDSIDSKGKMTQGTVTGPFISVRHPLWTAGVPRQDIPVYIFTIAQWNDMQADKFHIGAAPINPRELARNSVYVFALPARYNFAYPVGFEEVDQIIQSGALKAF